MLDPSCSWKWFRMKRRDVQTATSDPPTSLQHHCVSPVSTPQTTTVPASPKQIKEVGDQPALRTYSSEEAGDKKPARPPRSVSSPPVPSILGQRDHGKVQRVNRRSLPVPSNSQEKVVRLPILDSKGSVVGWHTLGTKKKRLSGLAVSASVGMAE